MYQEPYVSDILGVETLPILRNYMFDIVSGFWKYSLYVAMYGLWDDLDSMDT